MKKMIEFDFKQILDHVIVLSLLHVNINKISPRVVSWEMHYGEMHYGSIKMRKEKW